MRDHLVLAGWLRTRLSTAEFELRLHRFESVASGTTKFNCRIQQFLLCLDFSALKSEFRQTLHYSWHFAQSHPTESQGPYPPQTGTSLATRRETGEMIKWPRLDKLVTRNYILILLKACLLPFSLNNHTFLRTWTNAGSNSIMLAMHPWSNHKRYLGKNGLQLCTECYQWQPGSFQQASPKMPLNVFAEASEIG